ncbi:MAG: hypothetical protein IKW28_11045 [Lachnospiraceae bacterium]|nr:hypothetical protein [Lachnospiraceae bacterium]
MPFTKGGVKPAIKVTDPAGKVLKAEVDYAVSYKNNTKLGKYTDGKKAPAVVVKGKGNYAGTVEVPFTIIPKDITVSNTDEINVNVDDITVVAADKVVNFKNKGWKSAFKVLDQSGKALTAGDAELKKAVYTIEELPASSEGITNYAELVDYQTNNTSIPDGAKIPAGTTIKITVALKGDFYQGTVSGTYRILEEGKDISKFTFKIKDQAYTGDGILLDETSDFTTIQYKKQNIGLVLEEGTEQTLEVVPGSYVKNINKGTAKVTLRGKGAYGGTKTVSFKIVERTIKDNNFNAIYKGLADVSVE